MKNSSFRDFIHSFTPYQITYLVVVFALTAAFVIFLPDMMLDDMSNPFVVTCSVIAVLANPVCELLISKQRFWRMTNFDFLRYRSLIA